MSENEDRALTEPGGKIRLYVDPALGEGACFDLSSQQSHYLLHVMRAHAGDRVGVFNGRDGEWLAEIVATSKRGCTLSCLRKTADQADVPDLWLAFAPIKKTAADYVAQKATELGARVLQPVFTRRTIVHRVNVERMRANTVEAAEQSGRVMVPEVREAVELDRLLQAWPPERRILFCDETGGAPIVQALGEFHNGPWAILTGPEGGFDGNERALIRANPLAISVSLGRRILRADTAALAALSIWQAIKGDWR
ncbi:MAG: 16S rRNA (uracil(1498)-N(3))-methyltransferase [Rhizomicrobium sp.]|jgi:16S rRNA (uracil1498-N3)-methyltransferase